MTPTEHPAETPSAATGLFATLQGLLRAGRTGAPALRLVGLVAVVASAFLAPSAASAAAIYNETATIAGPEAGVPFGALKSESVAIDGTSGQVLVADSSDGTVYRFSSPTDTTPQVLTGFGGGSVAVAIDQSNGDFYVADSADAVIRKFEANGTPVAGWATAGVLNGSETPAAAFSPAAEGSFGIAVDQQGGDLYAIDAGHEVTDIFNSVGHYEGQIQGPSEAFGCGGAYTDGIGLSEARGELLLSDSCAPRVYRLALSTGALLGELDGADTPAGSFGGGFTSLAVDPSHGGIYVNDTGDEVVDAINADGTYSGTQVTGAPSGSFGGLTVAPSGHELLVADGGVGAVRIFEVLPLPAPTTLPATVTNTTTATLNGEVNPDGVPVTGCFFEWGETTAYGETALCGEDPVDEIGEGNAPVPVDADLSQLRPGTTYHYRLLATNENGTNSRSGDRAFATGPAINSTSVSGVSAGAARLEAEINPNGLASTYRFELDTVPYGEGEAPHGTPVPEPSGSVGEGSVDVLRTAALQTLAPGTTYFFRVVAVNALGEVRGPGRSFTTVGLLASPLLPDGRGWELVSPPEKHGSAPEAISELGALIQAAADGHALAWVGKSPISLDPAGNRSFASQQMLTTRGVAGWQTEELATPHEAVAGLHSGELSEYHLFSSDLGSALVLPSGHTPLSPLAGERTPYRRLADGSFEPLVYPGNVPPGTKFGAEEPGGRLFPETGVQIAGASADLSHVLLSSPHSLVAGFETDGGQALYEWSGGSLQAVSILPDGESAAAEGGVLNLASGGNGPQMPRDAISADGGRVFFGTAAERHLYVRDTVRGESVQLDAPEAGASGGPALFQGAGENGALVYFTDEARLTGDSGAGAGDPDLYVCDVAALEGSESCAAQGQLTDLTPAGPGGEAAGVQGALAGISADGKVVYLVANGVLQNGGVPVAGATPGNCKPPSSSVPESEQSCNLYRLASGQAHFLARLGGPDGNDWGKRGPTDLSSLSARVSPNGRFLAFMSERPLTGYDNRDQRSGARDEEVFLYDADTDRLICASCNPTGARPLGLQQPDYGREQPRLLDRPELWSSRWLAASVPGWTADSLSHSFYQSRYLSNSGRLFFNAYDSLSPADSNGTADIYQFESPAGPAAPGSDSCSTGSPSFSATTGGCVALISSGTSGEESVFLDASESGDDVFFLTAARLASADVDAGLDVYDARVCTSSEPCAVAAAEPAGPCSGEECQPPVSQPDRPTPATSSFTGPGNPRGCPRGKVKQKGKCVKQQKKKSKKKNHDKNKKKGSGKKQKRANSKRGGHK